MRRWGSLAAVASSVAVWILPAAAALMTLSGCAGCQSTVGQASLPPIAGGSFDGVVADQGAHRLYLADRTKSGVDFVDISSPAPRFMGTVDVAASPNGLAVAPELHRLYAGLAGGTLAVIDTETGSPTYMQVIKQISVGSADADLLDYSPTLQRVFVATGSDGQIVAVDAIRNETRERFILYSPVGQPRFDAADGMLYVTTANNDSLVRINPADGARSTISVAGCHPNGLAINPLRQLALTTCRSSVAVVNLRTGAYDVNRVVAGGDIVSYESTADRFVVASPHDAKDSVVGVFYGDGTYLGSVASDPAAHGAAFDVRHGLIYAPGVAGLMSFVPGACEPPPDGLKFAAGMFVYTAPLLAFALFLVWYARRKRDGGPARPTWEELQKEDLANERERMRALEDAMLGPQPAGD